MSNTRARVVVGMTTATMSVVAFFAGPSSIAKAQNSTVEIDLVGQQTVTHSFDGLNTGSSLIQFSMPLTSGGKTFQSASLPNLGLVQSSNISYSATLFEQESSPPLF